MRISEYVRNGGKEIYPAKIDIMSIAETLPIAPDSGPDLRMDYRWIDLRDEKKVFMFKIQSAFENTPSNFR